MYHVRLGRLVPTFQGVLNDSNIIISQTGKNMRELNNKPRRGRKDGKVNVPKDDGKGEGDPARDRNVKVEKMSVSVNEIAGRLQTCAFDEMSAPKLGSEGQRGYQL